MFDFQQSSMQLRHECQRNSGTFILDGNFIVSLSSRNGGFDRKAEVITQWLDDKEEAWIRTFCDTDDYSF